jgi:hypothetical protein
MISDVDLAKTFAPDLPHERAAAEASVPWLPLPSDIDPLTLEMWTQSLTAAYARYTMTEKSSGAVKLGVTRELLDVEQNAIWIVQKLIREEQLRPSLLFEDLKTALQHTDLTSPFARDEVEKIGSSWHRDLDAALRVLGRIATDVDTAALSVSQDLALPAGKTNNDSARDRLIWHLFSKFCEAHGVDPSSVGFNPAPKAGHPFDGFYNFLEAGFSVFFPNEKFLTIRSLCDKMPTLRRTYSAT